MEKIRNVVEHTTLDERKWVVSAIELTTEEFRDYMKGDRDSMIFRHVFILPRNYNPHLGTHRLVIMKYQPCDDGREVMAGLRALAHALWKEDVADRITRTLDSHGFLWAYKTCIWDFSKVPKANVEEVKCNIIQSNPQQTFVMCTKIGENTSSIYVKMCASIPELLRQMVSPSGI